MFKRVLGVLSIPLLITITLLGVSGCSDDESQITVPSVVDDPWAMSQARTDWSWSSSPFLGSEYLANNPDLRSFGPEDRVEAVRWFVPRDRTLRRYLNPALTGRERDKTQASMNLFLRADDGWWDAEDWGGIMQGISRIGIDMSSAQFVEIWLNDGEPDITQRRGRVHIDFGFINEDGFWPVDDDGQLLIGTLEWEDGILPGEGPDGIWTTDEDIGLDGDENGPQRYASDFEIDGDSPYPRINGTARNNREDSEDLNDNTRLDTRNGYFTTTIDLRETESLVDVVYDYDDVADLVGAGIAWRKYRIPLASVDSVSLDAVPDLGHVTHVRIWYEDPEQGGNATRRLQVSDFKFVDDSSPDNP